MSGSAEVDIHIRGGVVVDGTRAPRFQGDVWIKDGRILQIGGARKASAHRTIDAEGLVVAPGFLDLHTHYDGLIFWDPWITGSGWHGSTSAALGQCGFGFAPCRPEHRQRTMLGLARSEGFPELAMTAGLLPKWDWETIPEYLDALERTPKGVNVIQYMPVQALLCYVMGPDEKDRRPTRAEMAELKRLLLEGMQAGLCGFSIQRMGENSTQGDYDGTPMLSDTMHDDDILALADVLRELGEGCIQITQATGDLDGDLQFEEALAKTAERPVVHNLVLTTPERPIHHRMLKWLDRCWAKGLRIYGQAHTLRNGVAFSLERWSLYDASPAWRDMTLGSRDERLAKLGDPVRRAAVVAEMRGADLTARQLQLIAGPVDDLIVGRVGDHPELERYQGRTLSEIGRAEGKDAVLVLLDLSFAGDLNVEFEAREILGNPDHTSSLIVDSPYTFPGTSDGGAHMQWFSGAAFPTDFLQWLVRDEQKVTLEEAHYRLSALPAEAAGFRDRGPLREGGWADVVVYDLDTLTVNPHWIGEVVEDLPGGDWRRVQRARGYHSIIVNGVETFADGVCTGATPGRLLRHGRG
jgi:N-acyl-D-amino-acid deacylase